MQEFSSGFNTKDYWKDIELVQTCIQGAPNRKLGEPLHLHFFAPLNEQNPSEEIVYDYKSMPSDYDLISRGEDLLFIEKHCLRICYYVQKVHG